jgi:dCMP deaminase
VTISADDRPSFDQIHMTTAWAWSDRATCTRLRVGAVLARESRTIATGYNGAPSGMRHCEHDRGYDVEDGHCLNANHAESNVIAFAARYGLSTLSTTLYITHAPCFTCSGLLISAGIERVVFDRHYRNELGIRKLELAGIEVEKYT